MGKNIVSCKFSLQLTHWVKEPQSLMYAYDKEIYIRLVVFRPTPSEKYEFVSWDDDIPNWMEK